MLDFLLAVVVLGVPLALFVKRREIARLRYKARFFTIVAVAWLAVIGMFGNLTNTDTTSTRDTAADGSRNSVAVVDTDANGGARDGGEGATRVATAEAAVMVARVIDGDTLELIDGRRVRVLGIDTPERGQPCYTEATTELEDLIGSAPVRLAPDPSQDDTDRYGRLLRYVEETHFLDGDVSVQQARAGMGHYYDVGTPVNKADDIREAEDDARERGIGIWADPPCAPEPEPEPVEDDDHVYVPPPAEDDDDDDSSGGIRSGGKPGCNPATARDGDGDGIVCER